VAVGALGLVELAIVLSGPAPPFPRWALALYPIVAGIYLAAGVVAWLRRPSNRMGPLMVAGAFVWILAGFANTTVPALTATGLILATVPFAIIVHLLHGFPSGRLRGRLSAITVLVGYFVCVVMQAPQYLFGIAPEGPTTVLQIDYRPQLAQDGLWAQWAVGSCVMIVTAILLARRRRRLPPASRRVVGPLFAYGIGAVLFVPISGQLARHLLTGEDWFLALEVAQLLVLAVVPLTFLLALLRGGFARTVEIAELGAILSADPVRRPPLTAALAEALGDPTLELAFWARDPGAYVDGDGRRVTLPQAGSGRAAVEVVDGWRRIGAIVYDATLIADPELVRSAGRVVSLALDNQRLTAELHASREGLRASRARIVEAADSERRRLARDLHDGLQARLVLLAMRADPVSPELNAGLQEAITELRELVQGVMPAALTERGLYVAARELAERAPIPTELSVDANGASLPAPVESTGYFVVSEALTNAVKHSHAHELVVRLGHAGGALRIEVTDDGVGGAHVNGGAGLRGMADRIDALGGRLTVDSPLGGGTSVVAEVPCGS
jgi:signal transduction histidine kinase